MELNSLNTGLDSFSIIEGLMKIERVPIDRMELEQDIINKRKEVYGDVLSRLNNLYTVSETLTLPSSFDVFKVTYSQPGIAVMNTAADAAEGRYSINVEYLAKAHTIGTDRQENADSALGLTEGHILINGVQVIIDANDSLNSIRDKINGAQDTGVTATVVDNVLRIQMKETGAVDINIEDNYSIALELGILDNLNNYKNEFIAASDASFTIDGQSITSSTNHIENLIQGTTLTLTGEGSTEVSIARDNERIMADIRNFVNQYNSVVDFIYSKVSERKIYPAETDADRLAGVVSGDNFLNRVRFNLSRMVTGILEGVADNANHLASIGISKASFNSQSSDNSGSIIGKLVIDEQVLSEAIDQNYEQVEELFAKNEGIEGLPEEEYGIAARIKQYLSTLTDSSQGLISSKNKSFDSELKLIDTRIEALERRLELKKITLTNKFIAMEKALETMDTQNLWLQAQIGLF
ncbi:MAG: flagellar filament capping protein FliD [Actinomycetota bacterium]|nr:flagellar filament capping protein FliD [Actinomycetota bacterium]